MSKKEDDETIEIIEEQTEEKVLVFNPAGFFIRLVLSIVFTVLMIKNIHSENIFDLIMTVFADFAGLYAMFTLIGFLLRVSGNYLVAIGLFIAAAFGYEKLFTYVTTHGMALEIAFNIVFTIILIAIIVRDIRKMILYFKYVR